MIARLWRGRVGQEHAEEYVDYVNRTGVWDQRKTPGNLASLILTRDRGDEVEILVFSLWESLERVRAFAGDSPDEAIYYPEDMRYLRELEPCVEHYHVPVAEVG